jgi:hypothetical protein
MYESRCTGREEVKGESMTKGALPPPLGLKIRSYCIFFSRFIEDNNFL